MGFFKVFIIINFAALLFKNLYSYCYMIMNKKMNVIAYERHNKPYLL